MVRQAHHERLVFGGSGRFSLGLPGWRLVTGLRVGWRCLLFGELAEAGWHRCQRTPGWARNYLTYFSVYSARLVRACARARTVPGRQGGECR